MSDLLTRTVSDFLKVINEGMELIDENGNHPFKIMLFDDDDKINHKMSFCEHGNDILAINFQNIGFTSTNPKKIMDYLNAYIGWNIQFIGWGSEPKYDHHKYVLNFFFDDRA